MNRIAIRVLQLALVGCAIAAVMEVDWRIVTAVFGAAFVGLLVVGVMQGTTGNRDYEACVLEFRRADESTERLKLVHPLWVVGFLVLFAALAGVAVWQNELAFMGVPFLIAFIAAIAVSFRRQSLRRQIWSDFAEQNGLQFQPGSRWNPHDQPTITGSYEGHDLSLTTVWQSNPHRRSSSETLIGNVTVAGTAAEFCVDNLNVDDSASDLVKYLFQQPDLGRYLRAARLKRVALSENELSINAPRIPQTAVELRFYCELLSELGCEIEGMRR